MKAIGKRLGGRCALHGEVNCPDCDLDSMLEREPDLADEEFSKCASHLAACHKALINKEPHGTCKSHLIKAMGALNNLRKALGDWQEAASADPERVNSQQ